MHTKLSQNYEIVNQRLGEILQRLALVEAKVDDGNALRLDDPNLVAKIGDVYEPKFVQLLTIMGTLQESMYLSQADINKFKEELIPGKADQESIVELNEKILNIQTRLNTNEMNAGKTSSGSIGMPPNYLPMQQTNTDIINRLDVVESTM